MQAPGSERVYKLQQNRVCGPDAVDHNLSINSRLERHALRNTDVNAPSASSAHACL
jgi:hypothetical protein